MNSSFFPLLCCIVDIINMSEIKVIQRCWLWSMLVNCLILWCLQEKSSSSQFLCCICIDRPTGGASAFEFDPSKYQMVYALLTLCWNTHLCCCFFFMSLQVSLQCFFFYVSLHSHTHRHKLPVCLQGFWVNSQTDVVAALQWKTKKKMPGDKGMSLCCLAWYVMKLPSAVIKAAVTWCRLVGLSGFQSKHSSLND